MTYKVVPLSEPEMRVVNLLRTGDPATCRTVLSIMAALGATWTWRNKSRLRILTPFKRYSRPPQVYSAFRRLAASTLRPIRFDRQVRMWIVDEDKLTDYVFSRGKRSKNYGFPIELPDEAWS